MTPAGPSAPRPNPCLDCGACCAFYRASFHWSEADDAGGTVPAELTEDRDAFRRAMRGTNQVPPRCVALDGEIGVHVACSIYDVRSSTCREFPMAWENGEANDKCDRARIAWGLPPLPAPNAALPLGAGTALDLAPADVAAVENLPAPEIAAASFSLPPCRLRPG